MGSLAPEHDFSHLQDVLGTLPMVKRYIVLCLCFSLDETVSRSEIESALRDALEKLAKAFSFLAGQVVYEGVGEGCSGIPKMVPLGDSIELLVNDLTQDPEFPSMAEMSKAQFPFTMLDPNTLLPPIAISWATDGVDKVAPVLLLQANFVKGGLLLSVSGNHHTMDMTGMGQIISLFSQACRGEPFTDEQVKQGNQSRRNVIPLLGEEYQPGPELDDVFVKPRLEQQNIGPISPPRWAYFSFKAESLSRLKKEASQQTLVPYISTDDAVGALCWQRTAKARESRLGSQTRTYFARPISVRKYFGLKGYLGHLVDVAYQDEVDVWERPLGEVTARLRWMLLQDDKIKHHVQAFATTLNRLSDKTKMINGANLDPTRDVVMSSYANIKCCELSFGPCLGMPDAARRPRMPAWPGLFYMMPTTKSGDIAVAFCAGEDDITKLREDDVLASYADYIG